MTLATFPGPDAPAPHAFAVEQPPGWSARAEAYALLVLAPDEHEPAFRPNLMINRTRHAAALDCRALATRSLADAERVGTDAVLETSRVGKLLGRPTYIQAVSVTAAVGRVAQLSVVFYGPESSQVQSDAGASADLYTLIGSCLEADAGAYAPIFLRIATSFTFGPRLGVRDRVNA